MKIVEGSITNPKGFKAGGFFAGIRKKKNDMAIIYSNSPCKVAGVFTKSTTKAAPVLIDMEIIEKKEDIRAVVINSGNANACTGEQGFKDARKMISATADVLNLSENEVMVSSTGVIGVTLPIDKIEFGIKNNCKVIDNYKENGLSAAEAIMTTDTFPKYIGIEIELDEKKINIGGIAKGSGMIHPNMGTMLAYITTDANISRELLEKALKESTEDSYNMISVDGDTSTNDTVLVLANGEGGNSLIDSKANEDYNIFKKALHFVNLNLAKQIVSDGEGAGKFIEVKLEGAKCKEDARKMAKAVTTSSLVKTAFFGEDANWGRIISAMGSTEIDFDTNKTSISFSSDNGEVQLLKEGITINFSEEQAKKVLSSNKIIVEILIEEGNSGAVAYGCDLSYDYVKINADYRT